MIIGYLDPWGYLDIRRRFEHINYILDGSHLSGT